MHIAAGPWYIDDTLTFTVVTHRFDTGALTDADAVPAYRVYEDETGTAILTGNMAKLDDTNTTGFYSEQITLSAANGFEVGKSYNIYVSAAVNSVTGGDQGAFKVIATAPTAAAIADAVWDEDATAHQTQGTFGQAIGDPGADSDTIWAIVNAIGATGTGLSAIPWNVDWDPQVQSEVEDALVVHRLDELLNADSDIDGAAPPTVGSVFHELMSKTTGSFTFDQTTDSLEAIRDRGDAAWITATGFSTHSAADIWAVATRQLTGTQTFNLTGDITGNLSGSVGSVTGNVGGNVTGTIGGLTAAALKDFFDTDSTTTYASAVAGSVVKEIADNAGGSALTEEGIADAVWDELQAGHVAAGSFGEIATEIAAILVDTGTTLDGKIDTIDTNVDSILADTGTDGVVVATNNDKTGYRLSATGVDDIHDEQVDGSVTLRQSVRLANAALGGKASGLDTTSAVYRDLADTKDRITATVDADGNRTAVTRDLT